jgi:hypothetical protein
MKALIFITAIVCVALTSCRTSKTMSDTLKVVNVRDSVNITRLQVIDTIQIQEKRIEGQISLDILKQLGSYEISKNGLSTNITYMHDTIRIETVSDSTFILKINEVISEFHRTMNHSVSDSNKSTQVVIEDKTLINMWKWLFIASIVALVYFQFNPISLRTIFKIRK